MNRSSGRPWLFVPVELALGLGFFMLHSVLQARATEMLPQARATAVAVVEPGTPGLAAVVARFGEDLLTAAARPS